MQARVRELLKDDFAAIDLDIQAVAADVGALENKTNVSEGTISESKAVVVDENKDISGFRNVGIDGVASLGAAPKLTVVEAQTDVTLTMTNAPTDATAGKDSPIYVKITVGTTDYVIPAWPLA